MRRVPVRFIAILSAFAGVLVGESCDRLTGTRPLSACIVDTTYWVKVVTPSGRIDSLEAHQTIDRCSR